METQESHCDCRLSLCAQKGHTSNTLEHLIQVASTHTTQANIHEEKCRKEVRERDRNTGLKFIKY